MALSSLFRRGAVGAGASGAVCLLISRFPRRNLTRFCPPSATRLGSEQFRSPRLQWFHPLDGEQGLRDAGHRSRRGRAGAPPRCAVWSGLSFARCTLVAGDSRHCASSVVANDGCSSRASCRRSSTRSRWRSPRTNLASCSRSLSTWVRTPSARLRWTPPRVWSVARVSSTLALRSWCVGCSVLV
jgi:hypothetical protein